MFSESGGIIQGPEAKENMVCCGCVLSLLSWLIEMRLGSLVWGSTSWPREVCITVSGSEGIKGI